jgi:hypothetical protein
MSYKASLSEILYMSFLTPIVHAIRRSSPFPQHPIGENTEHRFVHLQQQIYFLLSMSVLVGKTAPEFTAKAAKGNEFIESFRLSGYKGQYIVLFF